MSLDLYVVVAVVCLLVTSCIFIATIKSLPLSHKQASMPASEPDDTKLPRPDGYANEAVMSNSPPKEKPMDNENSRLFWIEQVPTELHGLQSLLTAPPEVQAQLLAAGDVLIDRLSWSIRDCLNRPISCDRLDLLAHGDNQDRLTPERVRAALAVAEASWAIWAMVFEFHTEAGEPSHQIALDERNSDILIGKRKYSIDYIVGRIKHSAGVDYIVAREMWHRIVLILRYDLAVIPGIRAIKSEGDYAEISVEA